MEPTKIEIRPDRAYSYAVAADALTICVRTLRERVKSGKVRSIPVSERRKAIPGSEIIRLLSAGSTSQAA